MSLKLMMQEAEKEAESLIKSLDIQQLPINPFIIAQKYKIYIEPKTSNEPGVSGFLIRVGNNFGIGYSTNFNNEGFINFTIAHELGHYFLPEHTNILFPKGDGCHKSHSGFVSDNIHEKQADYFAKSLLMPENLFLEVSKNAGEGFAAIKSLANLCKTSITATAIRFSQFSEDPVAVIMSCNKTIEYCFISEALTSIRGIRQLNKGSLIPPHSYTAKFNMDKMNILQGKTSEGWTNLDDWFEDAPKIEMKEDIIGLGNYGKTLTILFTNEPIDIDEEEGDDD